MTEPTPPTGRDDDFDPVPGADFDASLGLVHASIDDELTAEEQASIQPDETWRTRVSEARTAVDAVQSALPLPPVDEDRRETHLTAALAAFDELHGIGEDVAVPPPASQQHPAPTDASPSSPRPDELAHRRNAKEWLRRAPIGIAAAVLAAVVMVGATQLGDDDADETATVADSDTSSSDDAMIEAGDVADGEQRTSGAGPAPDAEADEEAYQTNAEELSPTAASAPGFYSMTREPRSVDTFVDTISAMIDGDMQGVDVTEDAGLDLGPACDRQQAVRLAATPDQESDLLWLRAVLDDRAVVGVIDRTDPSQVTIIDLDRCAVVAVESL